jgi:hypothetical protein
MENKALRILGDVFVVLLLVAALGYVAHIDAAVRLAQSFGGQLVAEGVTSATELYETLAAPAPEATPDPAPEDPVLAAQRAQYDAVVVKTALELQQFRRSQSVPVSNATRRQGLVALSNINPRVNVWHVLAFDWGRDRPRTYFHIENPFRRAQTLQLSELDGGALVLVAGGKSTRCDLWTGDKPALDAARASAEYWPEPIPVKDLGRGFHCVVRLKVGKKSIRCTLGTGSARSLMRTSFAEKLRVSAHTGEPGSGQECGLVRRYCEWHEHHSY